MLSPVSSPLETTFPAAAERPEKVSGETQELSPSGLCNPDGRPTGASGTRPPAVPMDRPSLSDPVPGAAEEARTYVCLRHCPRFVLRTGLSLETALTPWPLSSRNRERRSPRETNAAASERHPSRGYRTPTRGTDARGFYFHRVASSPAAACVTDVAHMEEGGCWVGTDQICLASGCRA